jgi:hypothetical protein
MRRVLLTTTCLMAFAIAGTAQTSDPYGGSSSATASKQQPDAKKEVTLRGCVEQTGTEYMLKTEQKKNVELETSEDLKPHVGHTVKVSGSWDTAADKSEAQGTGHDASGEHHEAAEHKGMKEHHFKVDKLEMVSEQCNQSASK